MGEVAIVKVGGSLFDLPALGPGLMRWVRSRPGRCRIVAGGGPAADVVRAYHHTHGLLETVSHWMAIRMMDVNGSLLKQFLGDAADVVNMLPFCEEDEALPGALSHNWRVTSDSLAARVAEVQRADRLVLLKSVDLAEGISWTEAAERGLVDHMFGEAVGRAGLRVEWINFRQWLAIG